MRALILGANGMLGHKLYQTLQKSCEVFGTLRHGLNSINKYLFFDKNKIIPGVDVTCFQRIEETIASVNPDVLINCIGITKAASDSASALMNIWVNALFPHQLYQVCCRTGTRFIHISTDCVFSGNKGDYKENETSDAQDIYGRTKYLGEVIDKGALTIRTSFIGMELGTKYGLIEWLLSNQGNTIDGYTEAIFSGFPTFHVSKLIESFILKYTGLQGLYHVSSNPISKYNLLRLIVDRFHLEINIREFDEIRYDRSLNSDKFKSEAGFMPPSWEQMIDEFARDAQQYQQWRKQ